MQQKKLDLKDIRHTLHKIPEIRWNEVNTQKILLENIDIIIENSGRKDIDVNTFKTGIVVFVKGKNPNLTIGYRCDMDALPVQEETGCEFASEVTSMMHACGHDVHMSVGLGVLENVLNSEADNNFVFLFQPAEEGGAGSKDMMESGLLDMKIDEFYGLHVCPDYPLGTMATKVGPLYSGCDVVTIEFVGVGGHGSTPEKCKDPLMAVASFLLTVQQVVSRRISTKENVVLTFGTINGGGPVNSVAESVEIKGLLRYYNKDILETLHQAILDMANGVALSTGTTAKVEFVNKGYEPINNSSCTTEKFEKFMQSYDDIKYETAEAIMASEDFGLISNKFPSTFIQLGVGGDYPLHAPQFFPSDDVIEPTVECLSKYLLSL